MQKAAKAPAVRDRILALLDGAKVASVNEGSAAFARIKPVAMSIAAGARSAVMTGR